MIKTIVTVVCFCLHALSPCLQVTLPCSHAISACLSVISFFVLTNLINASHIMISLIADFFKL